MFLDKINNFKIILGSGSPRRKYLLEGLGIKFNVINKKVKEAYPKGLSCEQMPVHLCKIKSDAFDLSTFDNNTILITADTIVCLNGMILGKPKNYDEAVEILGMLSGNNHKVITGVCIRSVYKTKIFYSSTDVFFKHLSKEEISYYVANYKPYDKAGAYGIQEWIGYTGIEKIYGSYFNVMGLPVKMLYEELLKF
jgi:septum formation protein